MFFLYFIFFNGQLSNTCFSESNGLIFTKISGLRDGWKGLLTWYITVIPQGMLPWQPIKVAKSAFSQTKFHCCALILKQIAVSQFTLQKIKWHEFLYIVYNFGELRFSNPRVYAFKKDNLFRDMAKIGISRQISEYPGPIIINFTGLVGVWVGMIIPIVVWRSPKGRCYGKQLNLGDVHRRRHQRPLLISLAFDNGLANREVAFKRFNGSNPATSCTNLVNFGP